jgi:hypothetical protein
MNRFSRIGIGALSGALITLSLHPLSQRYVLTPYLDVGSSAAMARTVWLPRNLDVLPAPKDTLIASVWMQAGAELLARGDKLKEDEILRLLAVAGAASEGDPDNAFWPQMEAVYLWQAGQKEKALESWHRAARCIQWNDYQSRRLDKVREELLAADGGRMSWHSAAAYFQRSSAAPGQIVRVARAFFEGLRQDPAHELQLRLTTLRNGRLMRDGSRSVLIGEFGKSLLDLSAAPIGVKTQTTPRQQVLARYELVEAARTVGNEVAVEVDEAFRENEAWTALAAPDKAIRTAREYAALSILTACLPGVFLGLGLVGLLLRGLVAIFERYPRTQAVLQPPLASGLGVLAGLALYVQTGLTLAAIAVAMCFGFLAYEPAKIRRHRPDRLRGGISLLVVLLAMLFAAFLALFWLGLCSPAIELLGNLELPVEPFGGNTLFLSLALLVLCLIFVVAPAWGSVEKVPTPFATVLTLREFSRRLFWGAVIAGVLAAPAAVYLDNRLGDSIDVILANEPAHYLLP